MCSQDLSVVTLSLGSLGICLSGARASGFHSVQGTASAHVPDLGKVVQSLQRIASKFSLLASYSASCFLNK